jgi:hypothetical protein
MTTISTFKSRLCYRIFLHKHARVFIGQNLDHQRLISSSTSSGASSLLGVGSPTLENYTINLEDEIGGEFLWENIPSGEQVIRLIVQLEDIYLDTWTFSVEHRDE